MDFSEMLAWFLLIFLAVYGCAQLIRRLCLWVTRCPDCALCCRVAVPKDRASLAPLMRCLQSQTVWDDPAAYARGGCHYTLLVLPRDRIPDAAELDTLSQENPAVLPIPADRLDEMLTLLAEDGKGKE